MTAAGGTEILQNRSQHIMTSDAKQRIIILGAGVTGLQTALSLLTSPETSHFKITLIAAHIPGDLSIQYTSPWAGGHWHSHATLAAQEAEVRAWDKRTYDYWTEILENGENEGETMEARESRIGLGFRESRNFWGKEMEFTKKDGSGLWWHRTVGGFEVLDLEKDGQVVPQGAVFGIKYKSVCINIPMYLEYLFRRVVKAGATVIKAQVDPDHGIEGVVRSCKLILATEVGALKDDHPDDGIFALVNATGLSARHFVGNEEGKKLFPIRGQTILVKGEAKMSRTMVGFGTEGEIYYVVPRPGSGTTILGGCKQVGNWDGDEDVALTKTILERVKQEQLAEDLRIHGSSGGEFEILSVQVGLRPGRKGEPRVEVEGKERVEAVWVLHSYGHSGAGYQNSIGSAEKIVKLINGLQS